MVRVLIVDDSPTARLVLRQILGADPEIQVIGTAANGQEALEQVKQLNPDVVTMDVFMPEMDGYEATRRIMQEHPVPIVVVSGGVDKPELRVAFRAIQAGALDVLQKPGVEADRAAEYARRRLVATVKLMASVRVLRQPTSSRPSLPPGARTYVATPISRPQLIGVVASTGGPMALNTLLSGLPEHFPVPIAVVQHMAPGFLRGLVDWLQGNTSLRCRVAQDGESPQAGTVYFAPDDRHLVLSRPGRFRLEDGPPVHYVRPSGTVLLESMAYLWGARSVGVVLTGMGSDGAEGLRAVHNHGGIGIVQDEASSAVWGMPRAAVEMGAADYVLPLEEIGPKLLELVGLVAEVPDRR